jgi:protein involved in polysaccharide export with SLBB domain
LGAALLSAVLACSAGAQTPTADQLNALKQLPPDQQNALLQSLAGRGDSSGKKTDPRLSTPETVQPKSDTESTERYLREKTSDGRRLRLPDEDPELRPDDAVLIELTLIDAGRRDQNASDTGSSKTAAGATGLGSSGNPRNGAVSPDADASQDRYGPRTGGTDSLSDDERSRAAGFRDRIMLNNPYHLNKFGVLELPGLPSIPLAGLTAGEATQRLSADPDLRDFRVKLTLLRLQEFGEDALKPFGYDLFEGVPSTFAPVSDIQVPIDYLVGPGDTLEIQLYGNEPATYSLTVQRDGRVNFPKLGPIMVSGMSFDSARAEIERRVSQQLIGSRVSVTMGNLRSIRVFVLGEAEKPGSYTVSGLSSMTNALFVSGGVKKIGSLRNIELKRNGRLVTVLDLYDLLLHGDTSGDRQLMPGDVIFIPPIGRTVAVGGAVRRPAIYELKNERTVEQAIDLAGGLLPDSDAKLVQMERILPSRLHEMLNVDLTAAAGRGLELESADRLRVPLIRPTLENSVVLTGYVFRPGAFEYRTGLRLSDILGSFDELKPDADKNYVMIRREVPPDEHVEVVSADLERALRARGSAADPELKPRDKIIVFDLSSSRERIVAPIDRELELEASPEHPAPLVNVNGRVKAPGRYPLEPGMRVSDLIRAGGSLEDSAYSGDAELTRYEIFEGKARETSLVRVNLDAIRRGEPGSDLLLQPYDVLVIKPTPLWEEPGSIVVAGEVRFPGRYPIHRGETLSSVLKRAGGLTDQAFEEGAVFIRDELKQREKEQIDLLATRMQSDLASLSLEAVGASSASTNQNASSSAGAAIAIGQQLVAQLKDTQPVGRLVINIDRVIASGAGTSEDVAVRDGDRLLIPKKNQEITILGEVQSPTSHVYEKGLTRDDYIAKSGGITQKADRKRIYIVRANGDVISGERHGWFRREQVIAVYPGDVIVVPLDTERIRALPLWQAVTTIIYNLAVALLAVRSV